MQTQVEARNYNLDNTLLSSYACYLFERAPENNGIWIGIADPIRGCRIWQDSDTIVAECNDSVRDYLLGYVAGLQSKPLNAEVDVLNILSQKIVPGIRVPYLFRNKWHVLSAALLSVHARTQLSRAWFAAIAEYSPEQLRKMNPLDLRDLTKRKTGVSAGYRVRYIVETINDLYRRVQSTDPLETLSVMPSGKLRSELVNTRNVGPKVADCLLLNAFGDSTSPPVDVHVRQVAEYLRVVPPKIGLPETQYCRHFACTTADSQSSGIPLCPRAQMTVDYVQNGVDPSGTCMRAALACKFEQAGLVQANLFLFGLRHIRILREKVLCEVGDCRNCPLQEYCVKDLRLENAPSLHRRRLRINTGARTREVVTTRLQLFELYPESERVAHENAEQIERQLRDNGVNVGRYIVLKALAIWLGCRKLGLPILMDEVAVSYDLSKSDLYHAYREANIRAQIVAEPLKASSLVDRVVRVCGLDPSLSSLTEKTLDDLKIEGCSPSSVVAAALVMTSQGLGYKLGKRQVCQALMITDVTLRNVLKRITTENGTVGMSAHCRAEPLNRYNSG